MRWCNLNVIWLWALFVSFTVFIFSDIVLGKSILTAGHRLPRSNLRGAVISVCTFAATCILFREKYARWNLKRLGDGSRFPIDPYITATFLLILIYTSSFVISLRHTLKLQVLVFVWRDLLQGIFCSQRVEAVIQIASKDSANELMQFNCNLGLGVVHVLCSFYFQRHSFG